MPFLFLSPSTQEYNPYVTTGNEEYWMNRLADAMTPYLETSGINVSRNDPAGTVGNSIRMSNAGNYDFHLALHSNASPPATSGQQTGIDLYYYPSSAPALRMANILADNLRPIYPQPEKVRTLATTSLVEVRATRAPAVLAELGYHDNPQDAQWIENNLQTIARALATGVCEYFGLPLLSPGEIRNAVVSTDGSNLNLRGGPSATAPVSAHMAHCKSVQWNPSQKMGAKSIKTMMEKRKLSANWPMKARFAQPSGTTLGRSPAVRGMKKAVM